MKTKYIDLIIIGVLVCCIVILVQNPYKSEIEYVYVDVEQDDKMYVPQVISTISGSNLTTLILDEFGHVDKHITVDREYELVREVDIRKFISEHFNFYKYESEFYDCDDYAFRLLGEFTISGWSGIPIGVASFETNKSSHHVVNFFVDSNKECWLVNYNEIRKVPEDWQIRYFVV